MAITYVSGAQNSSTGSISVTWPTHQADDIAFLILETANETGFLSPAGAWGFIGSVGVNTAASTTGTALYLFWCRATSGSMPAATVGDAGNHVQATIVVYRGATSHRFPFDIELGLMSNSKGTASTTTTFPSFSTLRADTMPWFVAANAANGITGTSITWTSASSTTMGNLNSSTTTSGTVSGNGGQTLVIHAPPLSSPSSTGVTTAPMGSSQADCSLALGILDAAQTNITPNMVGSSTGTTGNTASNTVTCNYPSASASGDLLVMQVAFHRSTTSGTQTITTPSDWTLLDTTNQSSAVGIVSATYWRFRGAETSVSAVCSNSTSEFGCIAMHAYSAASVDPNNPVAISGATYSSASSSSATRTCPSVTTTSNYNAISCFVMCTDAASFTTNWMSSGVSAMTDIYSGASGDINQASGVAQARTAGATGTFGWNPNGALSDESVSATIAIQPVQETFVNGSDTAAGTDAVGTLTVTADASDAVAATDATVSLVTIEDKTGSDATAATDTVVSVVVPDLAASETAAATDAVVTLQQDHVGSDSVAATDATVGVQQDHTAADTAAATDTVDPVTAIVDATDTVAATDIGEASNTALADDTAAVTDSIVALDQDHTAGDTSTATDTSVLTGKEMSELDTVAAVDAVDGDLLAAVDAVDTVTAAEDANASTAVNAPGDSATGTDAAVQVDLIAGDQATGLDEAFVSEKITATQDDSAVGTDAVESVVVLTDSSDSASASDSTVLLNQEEMGSDMASATDAVVSLVITVEDDVVAVDAPEGTTTVLPAQSDSATVVDTGIVGVEAADTVTAVEGDAYYIDAATGLNRPRSIRIDPDLRVAAAGSESRGTVIAASSRTAAIVRTSTTRRKKIASTDRMVRAER